ncbi:MAG TPA: energy transducer TonB, partial [Thermoanaerobaculia bacterium]|nr:energy transducer TonB [Thermoanaerobaculia bacterium]
TEPARHAHITGVVVVEAVIGKDGRVEDVKVLKGLPMGLSDEAVSAVRQWRFKPGTLNGEPVDVIFSLTVNFKMD